MGSGDQKSTASGDVSGDMLLIGIAASLADWFGWGRLRRSGYESGSGYLDSRMQATGTAACKAFLLRVRVKGES
jgi:hypothetical protein